MFGSDVDYTKWNFSINDNLNFKLGGRFSYRIDAGGFLNANKVYIPDYIHYLGNQTAIASQYLNSFQLLPYYLYSNTENFYSTAHAEYHLDGLLTNKIPGFRKLNWFFVIGANALYINNGTHYYETFFSVENIFKVMRLDIVQGYQQNKNTNWGTRFTFPVFSGGGRRN